MIRHALYATLVGLTALSAGAQEAVEPELLGGRQQPIAAPAAEAQTVGQASAEPVAVTSDNDQTSAPEQGGAPRAVKPDPQPSTPIAAPPAEAQALGKASVEPVTVASDNGQTPAPEQGSAPQAVKPDLQASTPAAADPSSEKQQQTGLPAAAAAAPKTRKQAAANPKAKHPKHAARKGPNGRAYPGGHRGARDAYRWAWSPWYGFYKYRPRYYAYYGFHPAYRY